MRLLLDELSSLLVHLDDVRAGSEILNVHSSLVALDVGRSCNHGTCKVVNGDTLNLLSCLNGNDVGSGVRINAQCACLVGESGVNVFPIESWDPYTSRIDLSDWQGKKVKLAFVYKMMGPTGNVAYLDDISVKQFTPPTGPVASLSMDRYQFRSMFIGEKYYSDAITLTNTGKDGLQITGIDCPAGFSTTIANPESVDLLMNQSINFRLSYQAALTSAVSGDVVFHTTGGDVKVAVTA